MNKTQNAAGHVSRHIRPFGILLVAVVGLLWGCGAAAPIDPYASLNAHQSIETFLNAYQSGQYTTCVALLAPDTRATLLSPDSFALDAQARERERGKVASWRIVRFDEQGARAFATVLIKRTGDTGDGDYWQVETRRVQNMWKIIFYG